MATESERKNEWVWSMMIKMIKKIILCSAIIVLFLLLNDRFVLAQNDPLSLANQVVDAKGEAILSKASTIDDFLKSEKLVDEYFNYLRNKYGAEKFQRSQYDAILSQLKRVIVEIPELKERLWAKIKTGKSFSITNKAITFGRDLNIEKWNQYLDELKNEYKKKSEPILSLNKEEQAKKIKDIVDSYLEKKIKLDEQLSNAKNNSEKAKINQDFFQVLKGDQNFDMLLNFIVHTKLNEAHINDQFHSNDPDLILNNFHNFENYPREALKLTEIDIPEEILSKAKGIVPGQKKLLDQKDVFKVKMILTNQGKLVEAQVGGIATYHFKPLSRKFEGIFKGAPLGECVGGNAGSMQMLTPERWATIALNDVEFYQVARNDSYLGFIQTIPIKGDGDKKYLSVDYGAPVLSQDIVLISEEGKRTTEPMFEKLNIKLKSDAKNRGLKGVSISGTSSINNAGVLSVIHSTYIKSPLEENKSSRISDPLAEKIVSTSRSMTSSSSYGGKMILDATEPGHGDLMTSKKNVNWEKLNLKQVKPVAKQIAFIAGLNSLKTIPSNIWNQIPYLMSNDATKDSALNFLEYRKDWPETIWDHTQKMMTNGNREHLSSALRLLDKQSVWPEAIWGQMQKMMTNGNREDLALALTSINKQLVWPETIWDQMQKMTNNGNREDLTLVLKSLNSRNGWPEGIWDSMQKAMTNGSREDLDLALRAIDRQRVWPEAIWDHIQKMISNGNKEDVTLALRSLGHRSAWPKVIWDQIPALIKNKYSRETIANILVNHNYSQWPDSPDEVLKVLPVLMKDKKTLIAASEILRRNNFKNLPKGVWAASPALFQSRHAGKNMLNIATAQKFPVEFLNQLPTILETEAGQVLLFGDELTTTIILMRDGIPVKTQLKLVEILKKLPAKQQWHMTYKVSLMMTTPEAQLKFLGFTESLPLNKKMYTIDLASYWKNTDPKVQAKFTKVNQGVLNEIAQLPAKKRLKLLKELPISMSNETLRKEYLRVAKSLGYQERLEAISAIAYRVREPELQKAILNEIKRAPAEKRLKLLTEVSGGIEEPEIQKIFLQAVQEAGKQAKVKDTARHLYKMAGSISDPEVQKVYLRTISGSEDANEGIRYGLNNLRAVEDPIVQKQYLDLVKQLPEKDRFSALQHIAPMIQDAAVKDEFTQIVKSTKFDAKDKQNQKRTTEELLAEIKPKVFDEQKMEQYVNDLCN